MKLESQVVQIPQNVKFTLNYLHDLHHLEKFLPDDCFNWNCDGLTCSFETKGNIKIILQKDHSDDRSVSYKSLSTHPMSFTLKGKVVEDLMNACKVQFEMNASINPIVGTMMKPVFTDLINKMLNRWADVMNTIPQQN
jgi:hypothetical protein